MVSLGCPKNLVDGEVMLGQLKQTGHRIVASPGDADVIVVNTCAFIDRAKQEAFLKAYLQHHGPLADFWQELSGDDELGGYENDLRLTLGSKFEHNDFSGFEIQPNARIAWSPDEAHTIWGAISRAARTPARGEQDVLLRIQPEPDPGGEMKWAEGWYDCMYGRIYSRWESRDNQLVYEANVPSNTTATLYLPASSENDVRENGHPVNEAEGIKFIRFENGKAVYTLQSGNYRFEAR